MTDKDAFIGTTHVSRETLERFEVYEALLVKWNPVINLVSRSTLQEVWTRHFLDSLSAYSLIKDHKGRRLDLGSGAGFPAVPLAIKTMEEGLDAEFTCIEADIRKCEFLRTVARTLGLKLHVFSRRIEETPNQNAEIVTARALTSLDNLLGYTSKHITETGKAVFHKGEGWQSELEEARRMWKFDVKVHPSDVRPGAALLEVRNIEHV